jgi:hypothetical protein
VLSRWEWWRRIYDAIRLAALYWHRMRRTETGSREEEEEGAVRHS